MVTHSELKSSLLSCQKLIKYLKEQIHHLYNLLAVSLQKFLIGNKLVIGNVILRYKGGSLLWAWSEGHLEVWDPEDQLC